MGAECQKIQEDLQDPVYLAQAADTRAMKAQKLEHDPDGAFLQVIYGLRMGGATPPPEPGAHRLIVRVHPRRAYAPFPFSSE